MLLSDITSSSNGSTLCIYFLISIFWVYTFSWGNERLRIKRLDSRINISEEKLMKLLTSSCTRTFLTWRNHAIPFVRRYRQRIPRVAVSLFLRNYNSRTNKQTRDVSRPWHRNDIMARVYLSHGYEAVKNLLKVSCQMKYAIEANRYEARAAAFLVRYSGPNFFDPLDLGHEEMNPEPTNSPSQRLVTPFHGMARITWQVGPLVNDLSWLNNSSPRESVGDSGAESAVLV